jgi:hypothetical protein
MNGLSAEFEPYGALGELIERFHRCRQLRGIGKGGKFLACRPCRDLRQLQLPSCLDRLTRTGPPAFHLRRKRLLMVSSSMPS